jgi:hypothetical protein
VIYFAADRCASDDAWIACTAKREDGESSMRNEKSRIDVDAFDDYVAYVSSSYGSDSGKRTWTCVCFSSYVTRVRSRYRATIGSRGRYRDVNYRRQDDPLAPGIRLCLLSSYKTPVRHLTLATMLVPPRDRSVSVFICFVWLTLANLLTFTTDFFFSLLPFVQIFSLRSDGFTFIRIPEDFVK